MKFITTITQKGQITIPKEIRDNLSIELYDKVIVEKADDHIRIIPTQDILDIADKFKTKKFAHMNPVEARKHMENNYKRV